jgi:uncharacterized membrane protein YphA (DoxX/SURF4 family)
MLGSVMPGFVGAILGWRSTALFARLALVSAYLLGAAQKLLDFPGAVAEQAHFGMHPPAFFALLTVAVETIGPLLILSGRLVWLGAGMLGIFTGFAAFTANSFWTMHGTDAFIARNAFFEHLGLIGGCVLVAMLGRERCHG